MQGYNADAVIEALAQPRKGRCFPQRLRAESEAIAASALALMFPPMAELPSCDREDIARELSELDRRLREFLADIEPFLAVPPASAVGAFIAAIPAVRLKCVEDAEALLDGDPAATSLDEVILAYPGFYATAMYRVANQLLREDFPLLPRLIAEHAHRETGIDIHPGARIGPAFCIDHGTGVVIGETTDIGNRVRIYQGVTLGALIVEKRLASAKRHPTIGDNVVIYANATILGGDTEIGHDSIIGGNAWITSSVPPFSAVSRTSEVRSRRAGGFEDIDFII